MLTAERRVFVKGPNRNSFLTGINGDSAVFVHGHARVGYRRLLFPLDAIDPFREIGFEPSVVTEFVAAPLPARRQLGVCVE